MPEAAIAFINNQSSGLDPLGAASPVAMNVMVSGTTLRRRPGLTTYAKAPSSSIDEAGVTGLHVTNDGTLVAVGGVTPTRNIYKVTATGAASLSGVPNGDLRGRGRPQFVETEPLLGIAGGDRPQKVLFSPTYVSSPLANAPKTPFLIGNSQRLLALTPDAQDYVAYSGVQASGDAFDQFEQWGDGIGTSGFFPAGARPDPIVAIAENTNEVFVWGTTSLQVFRADATNDFSSVSTQEVGLSAPYSVVKADQQFAWLDHLHRFVLSDGRTVSPISGPIQQNLNDLLNIQDCFGYRFIEGPADCFVWTFPTDQRTFVFQKGSGWSEWQGWNLEGHRPSLFPVTAHHLRFDTAENLVGLSDGRIAKLSNAATTDLGATVNAYVTTGFENHGTDARKQCVAVRLALRRGETKTGLEPVCKLFYRDSLGPWSAPILVGMGSAGVQEIVVQLRSVGPVYRRRQWKFEFSSIEPLVLAGAAEEFEVLG